MGFSVITPYLYIYIYYIYQTLPVLSVAHDGGAQGIACSIRLPQTYGDDYIVFLRRRYGDFDTDIVVGEPVHDAFSAAVLEQYRTHLSDVPAVERLQFFVAQRYDLTAAFVLDLRGNTVGDEQSFGAGTLTIAEYMELCHIELLHEGVCLLKEFFGFAPRAHNDIDSDKGIGHQPVYVGYLVGKQTGVIATVHELEHRIGTALQGDMEMRHELAAAGTEGDDLVGEQVGFNAADAKTLNALNGVQGLHEFKKRLTGGLAKITYVNSCDDDFARSFFRHQPCLLNQ